MVEELYALDEGAGAAAMAMAAFEAQTRTPDAVPPPPDWFAILVLSLHIAGAPAAARQVSERYLVWLKAADLMDAFEKEGVGSLWPLIRALGELPDDLPRMVRAPLAAGPHASRWRRPAPARNLLPIRGARSGCGALCPQRSLREESAADPHLQASSRIAGRQGKDARREDARVLREGRRDHRRRLGRDLLRVDGLGRVAQQTRDPAAAGAQFPREEGGEGLPGSARRSCRVLPSLPDGCRSD